jgi:hypothetical protein
MASATAPSTMKPAAGAATKMPNACAGFNAASTPGASAICNAPLAAMTANHKTITGPKRRPTRPVPPFCKRKSASNTTMVSGRTKRFSTGVAMPRPSTALSTEIAGVIMLSP